MKVAVFASIPVHYDEKSGYTANYTGLLDWIMVLSKYVTKLDIYLPAYNKVGRKKLQIPKNVRIFTYGNAYLSKLGFISKMGLLVLLFLKKHEFRDYDFLFFTPPLALFSVLFKIKNFTSGKVGYILRGDFIKTSRLSKSNYRLYIFFYIKYIYNRLSYFIIKRQVERKKALCISIGRYILKNNFRDFNSNMFYIEPMISADIVNNSILYRTEKKSPLREFSLLYVGRLSSEKGVENLILALPCFKSNNLKKVRLKLKIIGSGPLEAQLKMLAKRYHLESEVEFLGFVPNDRITEYYDSACIFVNPAYTGSGRTVYEALARGLPVITTSSGIDRILYNNKNCILIESSTIENLVKNIKLLINNKKFARKLSINGLKTAKKVTFESQCFMFFQWLLSHYKG